MRLWPRRASCKWDPSLPWYSITIYANPFFLLAKYQHLPQNFNKQPTNSCPCLLIPYRNFGKTNKEIKKTFWIRMPYLKKKDIVILSLHTVISEQNKTHLLIFVTLLVFCRQIAFYSFCLALKDFEREPCQFFRCLTPKLKKNIGQGFVQLLSCL